MDSRSIFGLISGLVGRLASFAQTIESPSVVPVGNDWIESDLMAWCGWRF